MKNLTRKKRSENASRSGTFYKPLLLRLNDAMHVNPLMLFVAILVVTIPLALRFDLAIANPLQVAYTTSITLFLIRQFEESFDKLKPYLTLSEAQFARERERLSSFKKTQYFGWTLLAPLIFLFVNGRHPVIKNFLVTGEMPAQFAIAAICALLTWVILLQCVIIQVSNLLRFRKIGRLHTRIDLLNLAKLHPFGHMAVRTLLLSVGSYTVIPISFIVNGMSLLGPALMSVLIGLPVTITCFFLPIAAVMRRIKYTKGIEIDLINRALSGDKRGLDRLHLKMGKEITNLDLLTYRQFVEKLGHWPIGDNGVRRLLAYIIIPLMTWGFMSIVNTAAFAYIQKTLFPMLKGAF